MKMLTTSWDIHSGILHTRLQGLVNTADVETWAHELHEALDLIPTGTEFKILANLFQYEPGDMEAHKAMRSIIPGIMLDHGFLPGYTRLYPDQQFKPNEQPVITCIGAAHVHHDEVKMLDYRKKYGSKKEWFFTDSAEAYQWLKGQN